MREQDVDRLSALPDGLICHILSFMPTQLSVKTSILSKRWRFLWAHVPILDFRGDGNGSLQRTSFAGIVCALMLRHKVGSLTTFRLFYRDYHDDDEDVPSGCYEFETCIATAIERNVQNLHLGLAIELPECLLTCKTIVDLRLDGGGVCIPSSGPIYLPSLKKLYFEPTRYDVHFPRLVSGCPVIEELIIDEAACFDLEDCTISSPTLKRFTFNIPIIAPEAEFRMKIDAPALRYLTVCGDRDWQLSVPLMKNLIEAYIILSNDYRHVLNLLDSLCNVKCLRLPGCYDCDVPTMPGPIVKFYNLTKLQLSANWFFIKKFLESADNLQELIISEGYGLSKNWMDPIVEECACLLHSLRTVRIDGFRCTEEFFNMVRYILRNAQVLEKMEIYCFPRIVLKEKFDALQRIASLVLRNVSLPSPEIVWCVVASSLSNRVQ